MIKFTVPILIVIIMIHNLNVFFYAKKLSFFIKKLV